MPASERHILIYLPKVEAPTGRKGRFSEINSESPALIFDICEGVRL